MAMHFKEQQVSFPKQAYLTSSAVLSWKKLAVVTVIDVMK